MKHIDAHAKSNPLHCMSVSSLSDANGRVWVARMMTASGIPVARGQGLTPGAALSDLNDKLGRG